MGHQFSALAISVFAALSMGACERTQPNFCATATDHNCLELDASLACTRDQDCTGAGRVCDVTGSKMCVQCTMAEAATACPMTMPVCEVDNQCHACTAHTQCGSDVCLPDGSCAIETSVAYVAPGGSGTTCSKGAPCGTLAAGLAASLQRQIPYVKIATGLVKDSQTTTIDSQTVTILADVGAKLDRDGDGPILVVQSSGPPTNVQIFDLEITGATGTPGGDAIRLTASGGNPILGITRVLIDGNQGIGISASGGALTVSQSTLSGNQGGGITETNGTFIIVGNVFFNNGGINSSVGGIAISTVTTTTNRLEFNSFALNTTQDGVAPALQCVAGTFTARNNIMSDNRTTAAQADQVGGTCVHTYSIAQPGTVPGGPAGATNSGSDPLFANPAKGDLHLQSGSPARHAADPSSDLTGVASHDIDGTLRVMRADIGAYEFK